MVSQWIRLFECNYFEITILMITLDSRVHSIIHIAVVCILMASSAEDRTLCMIFILSYILLAFLTQQDI